MIVSVSVVIVAALVVLLAVSICLYVNELKRMEAYIELLCAKNCCCWPEKRD